MNEPGKSDRPVVPEKSANKSIWTFVHELAERTEGRGLAKENGDSVVVVSGGVSPAGPAKQVDRTQRRLRAGGNAGS